MKLVIPIFLGVIFFVQATTIEVNTVPGSPFAAGDTPFSLSYAPSGRFAAVVNSNDNNVQVYTVNASTGVLSSIGTFTDGGSSPRFLAYSPNSKFLTTANISSISSYRVNQITGALTAATGSPFPLLVGLALSGVVFSPDGNFVAAASQNTNEIFVFSVDQTTGVLTAATGSPFAVAGSTPIGIDYSPDGNFLAVSFSAGATPKFQIFSVNKTTGAISSIGTFNFSIVVPAGVDYNPLGQYLAIADQGASTVVIFSVDETTGMPTEIDSSPFITGAGTFGVRYSSNGFYLATSNNSDNTTSIFRTMQDGSLVELNGSPFGTGVGPVFLDFYPNGLYLGVPSGSNNITAFSIEITELGSDTQVERFGPQPVLEDQTRIATFAALDGGFKLLNSDVTVFFDSIFPVSGSIDLMGGTLVLDYDLIQKNESQLGSLGAIVGNNHVFSLAKNISLAPTMTSTQCFDWGNLTVCLNSNIILQDCCITFTGNSTLDGRGHCLTLEPSCALRIAENATLLMKNIIVQGVQTGRIIPLDSTSTLSLKSAEWVLDGNYTFTQGTLDILKQFKISGRNRSFAYESNQISTIGKNATLQLDAGITFSYQPSMGQDRIQLLDPTSTIFLKKATLHASDVGLQLEKGIVQVDRESFLSSDGINFTTGIKLGDGASAVNNISLDILPAAQLKITRGFVVDNNV